MEKKEVQRRVLKNGKPLAFNKFSWDKKTNTFSSKEDGLVIDFRDINECSLNGYDTYTLNIGSYCIIQADTDCIFNTGSNCDFKTAHRCSFNTGADCSFYTATDCTFNVGSNCTFKLSK